MENLSWRKLMETKINSQNLKFKNQINNFKNPVEIKNLLKKTKNFEKLL